jgi:hypothetical protein
MQYTVKLSAGTNLNLTVSNLTRGVTYYFNITDQGGGLESGFGGEVPYTVPMPPAPPPGGVHPPLVLTVQTSPSVDPAFEDWETLATLSVTAEEAQGYFRTSLVDVFGIGIGN